MHVFWLESHLQSPAHHVAPCPREHSSQLGARWLPQLTEFVTSENAKEIFFVQALTMFILYNTKCDDNHDKTIFIISVIKSESMPASLHLHPGHFL